MVPRVGWQESGPPYRQNGRPALKVALTYDSGAVRKI